MNYRKFYSKRFLAHTFTAPFIWLPLIALLLLDLLGELYHQVAFPIYKIPKVKRSQYIQIIDRSRLAYLGPFEKIGCMYCGYANGVIAYYQEIAGRTEKYWCGIMHEKKPGFTIQPHQLKQKFAKFGDRREFNKKYPKDKE